MTFEEMVERGGRGLRDHGRGSQSGPDGRVVKTGRENSFRMWYFEEGPNATHSGSVTPEELARWALEGAGVPELLEENELLRKRLEACECDAD